MISLPIGTIVVNGYIEDDMEYWDELAEQARQNQQAEKAYQASLENPAPHEATDHGIF